MRVFADLCPAPPRWDVPWARIRETFGWVRALAGVPQDAVHHAEGDVEVHTRLACEALASLPGWRDRPPDERVRLFTTVLMHDIAKPHCTRLTVTLLSGLPGAGKDHWIAANRPDTPVVSLDRLRAEMGVAPSGDQRAVAAAAHDLARVHLRAGRSFVWNATNVSRQLREQCTGLVADYRGRVEVVALEAPPRVLRDRNRARAAPVPDAVVDRLVRRWETPDPTEAHRVDWLTTA